MGMRMMDMKTSIRMLMALALVVIALPSSAVDFATRCQDSAVVRCVGFDQQSDINGGYGDVQGITPGETTPNLDTSVMASGGGSLRLTIPSNSGANTSGTFFTNFSDDLSVQFGGNQQFFIQWRQRFTAEFINTYYNGGGGWKQIIIGTGDKPGCTASTSANGQCYSSCTALETVVQNVYHRGFPQMYNSCTGSSSHGAYDAFSESFNSYDFKLQNARGAPYCLYSQGNTNPSSYFPSQGNCFGYFPGEWMTFQVGITTGPRQGDEFVNSNIKLWMAREGQPSELVMDYGPYNLTAGSQSANQQFGKVWLLSYNTDKNPSQSHATAYTWYDELIISRARIADPDGSPIIRPMPPTDLQSN